MFEVLDRQTCLTANQMKSLGAAILGDALEFFDYFLIGFVLAFLIGPWKLTSGQFAIVFLSSGVGAILGAYVWGWLADRIGRRLVFIGTVLNFSIATGFLYFTPENGWPYLTALRFFVGLGVGGLYCVDLPLVREFMPSHKRGWVGGLVTCVIPLGVGLGGVMGAFMGAAEWRLLFALGLLPALLVLPLVADYNYNTVVFGTSAFWLILAAAMFFADGGLAIVGPYAAEVWPSHLHTSGMGSAYGFGGIGKIVGSSNFVKPDVPLTQIPTAFVYLGCWFLLAGVVYYFFGLETKGKSIEQIDRELAAA